MRVASVALFFACIGCATHVTLPAPPDDARARVAYCDAMRPVASLSAPTLVARRGHRGVERGLELRDGTFVTAAEDLLPVVGSSSDAGVAAREAAATRIVADGSSALTVTTFLLGAVGSPGTELEFAL